MILVSATDTMSLVLDHIQKTRKEDVLELRRCQQADFLLVQAANSTTVDHKSELSI